MSIKIIPKCKNDSIFVAKKYSSKKKTHEQYVEELKIKNPNIIVLEKYSGANTKILHKDVRCGHEYLAMPSNILKGSGCKKCVKPPRLISNEEFLINWNSLNLKFEPISTYKGIDTNMSFRCKICGYTFEASPYNTRKRKTCNNCDSKMISQKEFERRVSEVNPNIILGVYNGTFGRISVICSICGHKWNPTGNSLLMGHGCPICSKRKMSKSEGIEFIKKYYPHFDILSYEAMSLPIKVQCKLCDNILMFKNGYGLSRKKDTESKGCKYCYIQSKYLTTDEYKYSIKELFDDSILVIDEYLGCRISINHKCKKCSLIWKATPVQVYSVGCPQCSNLEYRKKITKKHDDFVNEVTSITDNIEIIGEYTGCHDRILCKCKMCNKFWSPEATSLLGGYGCPVCSKSKGEKIISNILNNLSVYYIQNKTFEDLFGVGGRLLSYDFYIPSYNLLIEFQGKQHKTPIDFFGGEERFKIQQEHDNRKREYAKFHNIKLLEIWYYDLDNIEKIIRKYINNLKSETLETAG